MGKMWENAVFAGVFGGGWVRSDGFENANYVLPDFGKTSVLGRFSSFWTLIRQARLTRLTPQRKALECRIFKGS